MTRGADTLPRLPRLFYLIGVLAVLVPGSIAVLVCVGEDPSYWSDGVRWSLYMLATAVVAVILGLIFGVPRARTEFSAESTERYASNSNLEQISDWLTKLLVGAGLVELKNLPAVTKDVGDYLGEGMSVSNASAFSVSAVAYGTGIGFAFGYLWTRLRLRLLLETSDRAAADVSRKREQIVSALRASQSTEQPESERALVKAADTALASSKTLTDRPRQVLWVDDRPSNNTAIVTSLSQLGVRVDLALTTEEALSKLAAHAYDLIISDLGRTENGQENQMAGLDLIRAVRTIDQRTPIFIYAGARGMANSDQLRDAGATLVTDRPTVLLPAVVQALSSG